MPKQHRVGRFRLYAIGGTSVSALIALAFGLSVGLSSGTTPGAGASSYTVPAAVSAALTHSDSAAGGSTPAPAPAPATDQLGVYAGSGNISGAQSLGDAIGSQPKYAMEFLDGSTWSSISNPSYFTSEWQNSGYTMIWGVPMLPNSGATLAQGAAGDYNQYFITLAQNFVAEGQGDAILRIGWEFNGSWFPWAAGGQAANFVAYWQQIVDSMRSVPGANFEFEWNPTRGDMGVGNLADFYPGNNYVDMIGMDVYDIEWATYPGAQIEFTDMETQTYGLDWLASFAAANDKPITFPEWGLGWGASDNGGPVNAPNQQVSGGDDPTFINDMAGWIASHNVLEATFWDYGTGSVASGSNPNSLAALVQDFGPEAAADGSGGVSTTTTTTTTSTTAPSPVASSTTLAVSSDSANYGAEGTTQFTVTVTPAVSGSVKVNSPWTVCTATVTDGTGTCSLSNNDLGVGHYSPTAVFAGTSGVDGSTSAPVAFRVKPRGVGVTLSVAPGSVLYGSENAAVITAQVTIATGGIATGTVTVTSGSVTVCTIDLSGGSGSCSPGGSALGAGSNPLIGTYSGDASDAAARGHSAPLVVVL
jgi:glycosyl hydrolase family 26